MAADINLQVIAPVFPPGFCPSSPQNMANQIAAGLQVIFPGNFTVWNVGSDEPLVDNRDRPWLKLDTTNGTVVGVFSWSPAYGLWVSTHPLPPGGSMRQIWVGTLTDLETYDSGEAGTISAVTGPFWEVDSAFAGFWPIGVNGTYTPAGSNFAVFDDATPGVPHAIAVYFIKRSARTLRRGS
jgi:hypothetical protein